MDDQSQNADFGAATNWPIVVDLDGTITPSDTLIESIVSLVKHSPLAVFRLPFWLLKGRAGFKNSIAARSTIAAEVLPYNDALLSYLRIQKTNGRPIILATAAHESIALKVSTHLRLFDEIIATDASLNLKGYAKLEAIRRRVGSEFVYAGDSQADVPIWKSAKAAILVGVERDIAASLRREVRIEAEFSGGKGGPRDWLRAMRVHQWLKNLLLFVPLLTAFSFMDLGKVVTMIVAFLSFSFAASATYMINDLWDLESDRAHPRKRLRPFASGKLPILHGLVLATALLVLALALAYGVSKEFLMLVLSYLILTSSYTWVLKEYVLIDALTLALLYTLRILAGAVAVGIATSSWLLSFSVFMFLSLALVKRCAELVSLSQNGLHATRGRDYRVSDLVVLWPLGVGASLCAVVVFGLFISASDTQGRYATPQLLWLVALGLVYWLARLWIKTSRGEMDDDPVVYAIKDRGSRITILAMVVAQLVAHFLDWNW